MAGTVSYFFLPLVCCGTRLVLVLVSDRNRNYIKREALSEVLNFKTSALFLTLCVSAPYFFVAFRSFTSPTHFSPAVLLSPFAGVHKANCP